jgi:histidinol-phosphate aminotransferase
MKALFKESVLDLEGYTAPPQGEVLAKLNQNENPFDIPAQLKQKIFQQASQIEWNRYPAYESPRLRENLAKLHGVNPDQIVLGSGSNQLLVILLSATLDSSKSVLFCPPTFGLFEQYSSIYQANIIRVYHAPGQDFPINEVEREIRLKKPELLLLDSPTNPTGAEIPIAMIEKICEISPGLVLVDEAYSEFCDNTVLPFIKRFPHLIISRTFSKAFSLAGMRFGYLIGDEKVVEQLRKVNIPYNINLFTELVVNTLLENHSALEENIRIIKTERQWLYEQLCAIPNITVYPSSANFLLMKVPDGKRVFQELKSEGVLVRDVGSYMLLKDHLRVNVGTHEENRIFVDKLKNIVSTF